MTTELSLTTVEATEMTDVEGGFGIDVSSAVDVVRQGLTQLGNVIGSVIKHADGNSNGSGVQTIVIN
jgi:hypothetical protein